MNVQSFDDLYKNMKDLMIANQSKITDFNEGSVISTMFESIARILEKAYLDVRNGYAQNLKTIAYSVFGFQKKKGQKATATVVFSRSVPRAEQSIIPIGTRVSSGGLIYITGSVGVIEENEINSNPVTVQAEEIGTIYNVADKSINTIESILPGDIVKVENASKAVGGTEDETETEMLTRFKEYINGLQGTNVYGLKSAILQNEGVRSISIDEHFPPSNHIYNATVYVDDGTGGLTPELKTEIEDIINGDDTSTKPGKRAGGINIRVASATPVPIDVTVTCKIFRTEHTLAELEISQAIEEEINSLSINEDFVLTSLVLKLRQISYVKDVVIQSPVNNVEIAINQIARFGSATVNLLDA